MTPVAKKVALSTALALTSLVGGTAQASEDFFAIPDGLYVIDVKPWIDDQMQYAGCLIISNNGRDVVPSVYHWNQRGQWCGLYDDTADMLRHRQAVWEVYTVGLAHAMPVPVYVLKSAVNGKCLIHGQNGTATSPSLHLWTELGGDAKYCGFRNAEELIANGQAAWVTPGLTPHHGGLAVWNLANLSSWEELNFNMIPATLPNTTDHQMISAFSQYRSPIVFRRVN